jgi:predicted dehydrogenase
MGVSHYGSLEQMLAEADIDAVILATPIPLHAQQTIIALDAGKHVYIEKPPCATLGQWEEMRAAQEAAGKRCVVGFQMQSNAGMRFLRKQLAQGAIGTLREVWSAVRWKRTDAYYGRSPWVARWYADGLPSFDGPATNALAHLVQAAAVLSTPEGEPIIAQVRGRLRRARAVESYDSALLEARAANGVNIRLAVTHATHQHDEVVLHCSGDKGTASITWHGQVQIQRHGEGPENYHFRFDNTTAVTLDFLRAITDPDYQPATTLQDTLPYLQLVNGGLQSSGGADDFPAGKVHRIDSDKDSYFVVEGMDEQFAAFVADAATPPALLSTSERSWVSTDELNRDLAVPAES